MFSGLISGVSLAALSTFFKWGTQSEKKKTVKFLTQEGKLVEIEVDKVPTTNTAATKEDYKNWIKK